MTISVYTIEDKCAELDIETEYFGDDDRTIFTVTRGSKSVEFINGVTGADGEFRADDLAAATVLVNGDSFEDATYDFEGVESIEEFLAAVADCLA